MMATEEQPKPRAVQRLSQMEEGQEDRLREACRRSLEAKGLRVSVPLALENEWAFWYDEGPKKGMATADYESCIQQLGSFSTIQARTPLTHSTHTHTHAYLRQCAARRPLSLHLCLCPANSPLAAAARQNPTEN